MKAASTILGPIVAVLLAGGLGYASGQSRVDAQSRADAPDRAGFESRADARSRGDAQSRADDPSLDGVRPAMYFYDHQEIEIGPAGRQTVLTGFLLGSDVADLAVVRIEEDGGLSVRVYAFEVVPVKDVGTGQDEGSAKNDGSVKNEGSGQDNGPARDAGAGQNEGSAKNEGFAKHENRSSSRETQVNGTWNLQVDAQLRPGVTFVDVAHIGDRDQLITYEPGRLYAWDPDSETEHELVSVVSSFRAPREDEIPHVDVTRDVNGDGRIDLVVPGADGFQVFVQMESGVFADPMVAGSPTDLSPILGADGYRYDPWSVSRIHAFDYNGDARVDLVSWNGERFEAHFQVSQGLFDPDPTNFTIEVRFDADGITMLATGAMTGRALHSFTDMNGDGIADMVIYVLEGTEIAEKRSAFEVHFGRRASGGVDQFGGRAEAGARGSDGRAETGDRGSDGGTEFGAYGPDGRVQFSSEVDVTIQSDGNIQVAMDRIDFGEDAESGVVITSIEHKYLENSLFKRIKGFMGDDVWLNLAFHRIEAGRVPGRPAATRRIQLDGAPSPREPGWVPLDVVLMGGRHALRNVRDDYRRAFNKNLFIGDVTGNGRSDLLVEWTHRELHVYPGVPGPELFALQPQKVAVELPNDGEYAWMTDLNGDGRQDIVMHHPFTKRDAHGAPMELPGTEPQRVTLLISR